MSDRRPRNKRPRTRGGKNRLAEIAVNKRHNEHISALREALEPHAEELRGSADRDAIVARIRAEATTLASQRLDGDVTDVVEATLDEIFGLGPLEPALRDPDVKTIRIEDTDLFADGQRLARGFRSPEHARTVVDRILQAVGQGLGDGPSVVEARMMDGSVVKARVSEAGLQVDITRG